MFVKRNKISWQGKTFYNLFKLKKKQILTITQISFFTSLISLTQFNVNIDAIYFYKAWMYRYSFNRYSVCCMNYISLQLSQ